MKKQLLLAMAVGSFIAANAAQPTINRVELSSPEVQQSVSAQQKAEEKASAVEMGSLADAIENDAYTPVPEGNVSVAMIKNPKGLTYPGYMMGRMSSLSKTSQYCLIPADVELTWPNASYYFGDKPALNMSWAYVEPVQTEPGKYSIQDRTSTDFDLTTPGLPMLGSFVATPTLTFNDSEFNLAPQGMKSVPDLRFNFGDEIGVQTMFKSLVNIALNDGSINWDVLDDNLNALKRTGIGSWMLGGKAVYSDAILTGIVQEINVPEGKVFGIRTVGINAWFDAFNSERLDVDIYRKVGTGTNVSFGDRIGGGYLLKENAELDPDGYNKMYKIPIMEGSEGMETESFVNVDGDVLVVISGLNTGAGDELIPLLYFAGVNTSQVQNINSYFYFDLLAKDDDGQYTVPTGKNLLRSFANYTGSFGSGGTYYPAKCISWDMQYDGCYSTLTDKPADYFTMEVPAEGGEKAFVFDPWFDILDEGKFTGEGAEEWVLFDVEDADLETYEQTVNVMVDPLPEGVSGRETTVYVEICGAKQAINIKQGSTSAIDEIGADAEVVATQYYDLQGRALMAAPEAGLYLKKEVRANGNVSTVKVVK